VAEALDLGKATVNGAFTAMQKKGLGVRVEAEIPGAVEVTFLSVTEEGRAADLSEMGETIQKIVEFLSNTKDHVTLDDLAAAIGVEKRSVNGSFNSLVKKGLCARTPAKVEAMVPVKYLALTEAGMAYTGEDAE
jgi:predicted transcriptional regulator